MTIEATYRSDGDCIQITAPTGGLSAGQLIQLPDGRAGYVEGLQTVAAGDVASIRVRGRVTLPKTADIALLDGGDGYWDVSANKLHFRPESGTGDFFAGSIHGNAAGADTEVDLLLNERAHYTIDLERRSAAEDNDGWTTEATNGLGVTADTLGQIFTLSFDAVAEAAQAALLSKRTVLVSAKPIAEFRLAIFDIGDNAALDINAGIASGSHATDFESVAAFAAVQLDGAALSVNTHSDDGTTDRAPADSTIDAVDDTFFEVWVDARDDTDVQFYIDGVLVDTSATKRVLTAALATAVGLIVHVEKTNDDTVADVRVTRARLRTNVAA